MSAAGRQLMVPAASANDPAFRAMTEDDDRRPWADGYSDARDGAPRWADGMMTARQRIAYAKGRGHRQRER